MVVHLNVDGQVIGYGENRLQENFEDLSVFIDLYQGLIQSVLNIHFFGFPF